jgi:excisionase family DNA binding protein
MRAAKATRRATVGTKEAAALLGCSEDRVRRMIRTGELRAEKVRRRFGMDTRSIGRLTNGAAKKREGRGGTPPEPEEQVTAPPAPELPADAAPAAETPVAPEPDPKEAAAEAEAARLREERDRWQQLWGQAQEELGRLSGDAERARMLEARADGIAQAEARAQAEAERAKAIEARAEAGGSGGEARRRQARTGGNDGKAPRAIWGASAAASRGGWLMEGCAGRRRCEESGGESSTRGVRRGESA